VAKPQTTRDEGKTNTLSMLRLIVGIPHRKTGDRRPEQRLTPPNIAVEPTPYSLRSFLASAFGRGSPPALGHSERKRDVLLKQNGREYCYVDGISTFLTSQSDIS